MTRSGGARSGAASTIALAIPGRWAEWALCAEADPDAWFPDRNQRELTQLAKRICARYAVQAQCLDYALPGAYAWRGMSNGIWAGTTPKERAARRWQRPQKAAAA